MLIYNKICSQQISNKTKWLLKGKVKRHTANAFPFSFHLQMFCELVC